MSELKDAPKQKPIRAWVMGDKEWHLETVFAEYWPGERGYNEDQSAVERYKRKIEAIEAFNAYKTKKK